MNHRIFNKIEPQDVEDFLRDCEESAAKLGVTVDYYVEEFIMIDDEEA